MKQTAGPSLPRQSAGQRQEIARLRQSLQRSEHRLRSLERRSLEISKREKQRLGQDLHDGLGQLLTGIKFRLSSLSRRLKRQGHPDAAEVERLVALAGQAEVTAHNLAQGLQPIRKKLGGLATALENLAAMATELYQHPCSFRGGRVPKLPDEATLHIYRICQESVTNAMKHARPRHVWITLDTRQGRLVAEVQDDGSGLSLTPKLKRGLGLDFLRDRAHLIGAELTISTRPRGGTVVRCVLPLRGSAPARLRSRHRKNGTGQAPR